jgi:hypothetical protein
MTEPLTTKRIAVECLRLFVNELDIPSVLLREPPTSDFTVFGVGPKVNATEDFNLEMEQFSDRFLHPAIIRLAVRVKELGSKVEFAELPMSISGERCDWLEGHVEAVERVSSFEAGKSMRLCFYGPYVDIEVTARKSA